MKTILMIIAEVATPSSPALMKFKNKTDDLCQKIENQRKGFVAYFHFQNELNIILKKNGIQPIHS